MSNNQGDKKGITFNVYAVKDELTGKFLQPIFMENDEVALRWFKYVINNTEMWKYNAAMYSLYNIGTFNDVEGLADYNVNEMVAGGVSVLDKE